MPFLNTRTSIVGVPELRNIDSVHLDHVQAILPVITAASCLRTISHTSGYAAMLLR